MPDEFPAPTSPVPDSHPPAPHHRDTLKRVFIGNDGLRAGWKFLLFVIVLAGLLALARPLMRLLPKVNPNAMTAGTGAAREALAFVIVALTTILMIRIVDRKPWDRYGLPLRRAFRSTFWVGAVLGFAALGLQLVIMRAGGWFEFGPLQLHGSAMLRQGGMWALAFLMVGLFEEFLFRGYVLRVLTDGVGFWLAAALTSALFAWAHTGNQGENVFGIVMVFLDGMLMCFAVWKTGDLWFAVGQHAAWDWAETFFFGVPNSGTNAVGALRSPVFHGPKLLSGGTAGPEGSVLVVLALALTALAIAMIYRKRQSRPQMDVVARAA